MLNNIKSLEEDESIFESGKYLDLDEDFFEVFSRRIDEGFVGEIFFNSVVESEILILYFIFGLNE